MPSLWCVNVESVNVAQLFKLRSSTASQVENLRNFSLLFLFQVRREIFFAAADHGHETNAVALLDCARPTFQLHKTPVGEIFDAAILWVRLRRKEEQLHALLDQP